MYVFLSQKGLYLGNYLSGSGESKNPAIGEILDLCTLYHFIAR